MIEEQNNEIIIWQHFKSGDLDSFAQIYQAHFTSLYNYGYRYCGDASLTKDAIQQLFLKLWVTRENIQIPSSVRHYLIKSLRNTLIDLGKSSKNFYLFSKIALVSCITK